MSQPYDKIRAVPNHQFLHDQNGGEFRYLADTWWYGLTGRWTDQEFQHAVDLRKQQGFTAIQLVIGIPPEIPFWSRHATNDGQHPFLADYTPNPAYFDAIDHRMQYLFAHKIVPVIFGNWGYHIDVIGVEKMKAFWSTIIQRYGHQPVIYCLTGEVDLFPPMGYFQHGWKRKCIQKFDRPIIKQLLNNVFDNTTHRSQRQTQRVEKWAEVARYIKSIDPITALTVHPHTQTTASQLFDHPHWLDIDALQSGHSESTDTVFTNFVLTHQLQQPFLDLESPYEGIFNQFYGAKQIQTLHTRLGQGAAGFVYGAQGLWNLNTKIDPFLTHWGMQTWEVALRYNTATVLRKKIDSLDK